MDKHLEGFLLVMASSLVVGVAFISNTIALRYNIRPEIAALFLFAFASFFSIISMLFTAEWKTVKKIINEFKTPMICMGVLNAFGTLTWFSALSLLGPSLLGFLLRLSTIFIVILAVLCLKERFNALEGLGGLLTIIGAIAISYNTSPAEFTGIVFAVAASAFFAVTQLISKIYSSRVPSLTMNSVRIVIVFLTVALFTTLTSSVTIPPMEALFFLALGGATGPFLSFYLRYKAMEKIDLSKVAFINSSEPLVIALYSFIALGEILSGNELAGSALIFIGVLILMAGRKRPKILARWFP